MVDLMARPATLVRDAVTESGGAAGSKGFWREVAMGTVRKLRRATRRALGLAVGGRPVPVVRECPICGFSGAFLPFGIATVRADAMCPECTSLERHRLLQLVIERLDPLPSPCRMLHFAPEQAMTRFLRPRADSHVTADLMRDDVDLNLNIERIDAEDGSFDAVVCFHVLEHVDDRKALSELHRILRPGGLALLAVPIVEGWAETYEDPSVTEPAERFRHFGQEDHVRWYGRDFRDRVRAAGFTLEEVSATGAEAARHGLIRGETVFLARKPAAP